MKRFFLIDFENVSDGGLNGFFDLTAEDTVLLFYTQKANKINIDFFQALLARERGAEIDFIKVASGNQALDLQLASYLGSLISENTADRSYYIISKDKGFGCLPSFWNNRSGPVRLHQAGSIGEAVSNFRQQSEVKEPVPVKEHVPAREPGPVKDHDPAREQNQVKEPSAAKEPAPTKESAPVKERPAEEKTAETPAKHAQPDEKAAEDKPAEAKPAETKPAEPKPAEGKAANGQGTNGQSKPKQLPAPNEKSALHNEVQQTLSKAKIDNRIVANVGSLVAKTFGDKKIKQILYREIIKQYGQKKGLEIYNLIKPLLK